MTPKRIVILGAGISGLALAHRLQELSQKDERPVELVILERSGKVGGSIETEIRDGFLLEKGPDSFLSEKPWALELIRRLGIEHEVIPTQSQFRRTFVAKNGQLYGLPEGFYLIAPRNIRAFLATPLFSLKGKLRILAEAFLPPDKTGADESVASFIRRRFGNEALERVGQAMIAGVYSGDPEKLSILSTMPRFRELESECGSVIRGLRRRSRRQQDQGSVRGPRYSLFLSFQSGMEKLTRSLLGRLPGRALRLHYEASLIQADRMTGQWQLADRQGEKIVADALCVATPAREIAPFLKELEPKLSERLSEISYESVATLNVAFNAKDLDHPLDGFGFVVPAVEKKSLIACTFSSRKFKNRAPDGKVLLRAFVGGAFGRNYLDRDDNDLTAAVLNDLTSYLGIRSKPIFTDLTRYPDALPQYEVGHGVLARRIEREVTVLPNLTLTGASYRGTGIPDCIHDAQTQADNLWEALWKNS